MSVKCQVIIEAMERLAPKYLAESWDNVGLLLGSPAQNVSKLLITLDITNTVVDQAIEDGVDMIITHHPLLFKAVNRIRTDLSEGQIIASLLKANIAVYAAHTNLDIAKGGVNDVLVSMLNLQNAEPLAVSYTEKLCKLVVFVPQTHIDVVRRALSEAGAGHVGNYSHCTFSTNGMGSFLPLDGTRPFIGKPGTVEYVEEARLETIMPENISRRVLKAMLKAHPYEEVAYDLYQLANSGHSFGLGRVGRLIAPLPLAEFIAQVKVALNVEYVSVAGLQDKIVQKVAVCGGSGAGLIKRASFVGADVLITGDVKYHEAQDALAAGLTVIDAGHFATEQPVVPFVGKYLTDWAAKGKWTVDIRVDTVRKDVFRVW